MSPQKREVHDNQMEIGNYAKLHDIGFVSFWEVDDGSYGSIINSQVTDIIHYGVKLLSVIPQEAKVEMLRSMLIAGEEQGVVMERIPPLNQPRRRRLLWGLFEWDA